jgi:hypothetical protein
LGPLNDDPPRSFYLFFLKEAAVHRMYGKHRGHCVIINNHSFTSMPDRRETHEDASKSGIVDKVQAEDLKIIFYSHIVFL